ncbi:MAG: hypothetical protein GY854_17460, partial [Deltaproteobacteria bacterium]|nr:hypothetical protein [Deltaproteobacteria bacterium]
AGLPLDDCERGAIFFKRNAVATIDISFSDSDWAALIHEAQNSLEYGGPDKTYFPATFSFNGQSTPGDVAIRVKGHGFLMGIVHSGTGSHAFPLKVDFNRVVEGQEFDGLEKLNLHSSAQNFVTVDEDLSYGAMRDFGIPTARTGWAKVSVNGEQLGLYATVEQMNADFLRCHFDEPMGDLYKPEEPEGNLSYLGSLWEDYSLIEHKWPEQSDHHSFLNMIDVINHDGLAAFPSVLDVNGVMTYLASVSAVGAPDYYGSYGHNYYLFESSPGIFTMLPWDMNWSQVAEFHPCGFGARSEEFPITHHLLSDETHVAAYLEILKSMLAGSFGEIAMNARLDEIEQNLGDEIPPSVIEERRSNISSRIQMLNDQMNGLTVCPLETADGDGDGDGDGDMEACWDCVEEACETELDACISEQNCSCWWECYDENMEGIVWSLSDDYCNTLCGAAEAEWKDIQGCFAEMATSHDGPCGDDCR